MLSLQVQRGHQKVVGLPSRGCLLQIVDRFALLTTQIDSSKLAGLIAVEIGGSNGMINVCCVPFSWL